MTHPRPWLPAGAVAVSAVMWGCWWIPLRVLDGYGLPGDWASLAIYAMATAVLLPAAWARRAVLGRGGMLLLAVGVLFGVMLVLWNRAVLVGEVVRVTLLFYLTPVWATMLARVVLNEPVSPLRALSVVLGLTGAAVVLGFEGGLPMPRSAGDWLGLASGVLFAMSATCARLAGRREDPAGGISALGGFEQSFVSFAAGTAAALALALTVPLGAPQGGQLVAALPIAAGAALLWLLPQTWLVLWGAGWLDPGRTSILLLLEVVAAATSASLLTAEPFGWREAGGCVLILTAGAVEALALRRRPVAA